MIKRKLVSALPSRFTKALAVPYDLVQTHQADKEFRQKTLPEGDVERSAPDHIVCIVIDALRSDAVTPSEAAFLSSIEGIENAITPSTWTFPAVSSIVTGQYPHEHGAINRAQDYEQEGMVLPPRIPPDQPTLSERLAGGGYQTYGGFGHDTPFIALRGRFHTHALFHTYHDASNVLDNYLSWVTQFDQQRTFAYIHLADLHEPVAPPEEYCNKHGVDTSIPNIGTWDHERVIDPDEEVKRYREHRRRIYSAAVDYVDDQLARLRRDLSEHLDGDVAFIVTSDHGEAMWEQVEIDLERFDGTGCVGHGGTPYEAVSRVPLLSDGIDFGVSSNHVSLVNLAPTILDAVGLPWEDDMTGVPVWRLDSDENPLVEATYKKSEKKAVYHDDWKLIVSDDTKVGFSLPDEKPVDLPDNITERLQKLLPENVATRDQSTEVTGVVQDRLENLGYK
jgi:arylsulfatase A-like enzyme